MSPSAARRQAYREIETQLAAILKDRPAFVSGLASAAALLKEGLDHVLWVGFYLLEADGSLSVGPYQGPLACLAIPAGRGVCGAAVRERRTIVVGDVAACTDHIACDSRAKSEIVVPILHGERLIGVLDLDSELAAAFGEIDRAGLEAVADLLAPLG